MFTHIYIYICVCVCMHVHLGVNPYLASSDRFRCGSVARARSQGVRPGGGDLLSAHRAGRHVEQSVLH